MKTDVTRIQRIESQPPVMHDTDVNALAWTGIRMAVIPVEVRATADPAIPRTTEKRSNIAVRGSLSLIEVSDIRLRVALGV